MAIPSANADEVIYDAGSNGQALHLSLFGQSLTVGEAQTQVGSAPEASANGNGIANPLSPVGVTEAEATADGESVDTGQNCEGELPEIPGLALGIACSSSAASVTDGFPAATATAGIIEPLQVNPIDAILDTPLSAVVDGVEENIPPLLDGLGQVLGPIDDATDLGLEDTLRDVIGFALDGAPLATVNVGVTETTTTADAGGVTTACASNGARVDVLDPPAVGGIDLPPAISVIVGEAGTSVSIDGQTGEAAPVVNPSLVTVIVPSIPALADGLAVEVGQQIEIPLPEPLGTSTISVAAGETGVNEAGQTFAQASSISLDLLPGLQGGIQLALADCASVAGTDVVTTVTTETTTTTEPGLPKTGSSGPNGWALGATAGLAGLGLTLLRRTRTV